MFKIAVSGPAREEGLECPAGLIGCNRNDL